MHLLAHDRFPQGTIHDRHRCLDTLTGKNSLETDFEIRRQHFPGLNYEKLIKVMQIKCAGKFSQGN